MIYVSFPKLFGKLVNLRELSKNDATIIVSLMNYDISKYFYKVPYPYKIEDALKFIKSCCDDFRLHKGITFAIDFKNQSQSIPDRRYV
jgi:hypothetical protein